jgi:hypothetical protein
MLTRRNWLVYRKRKGPYGSYRKWEIEKRGWFLLGIVPLYICQVGATCMER